MFGVSNDRIDRGQGALELCPIHTHCNIDNSDIRKPPHFRIGLAMNRHVLRLSQLCAERELVGLVPAQKVENPEAVADGLADGVCTITVPGESAA